MRMRKACNWVGAFGPELMLCAATARIGPARTAWWAVWDGERLHERTSWWWSAGAGELHDGRAVTWNLVDGLPDGAAGSERAVWVDGVPAQSRRNRSTASPASAGCGSRRVRRARGASTGC
jgi:hypothetical protein